MRPWSATGTLALMMILAHAPAKAQQLDDGRPSLHVNDAHSSCFFDLHPELTKEE